MPKDIAQIEPTVTELRSSDNQSVPVIDTVLINDKEVLVSGEHPIKVHDIDGSGPVLVTLTLIVGRAAIGGQV